MTEALWGFIGAVIGAVVGATAALLAQLIAGKQQLAAQAERIAADKTLKEMDFERVDRGVRRQVNALVSEVGKFVYQCRTLSPVDWTKMEPVLTRFLNRIYQPDVPVALTDAQAEALYAAAGAIEVSYQFTLQQPWGRMVTKSNQEPEKYDAFQAIDLVKATFKDPTAKIASFWHEMGEAERASKYQAAADKPD